MRLTQHQRCWRHQQQQQQQWRRHCDDGPHACGLPMSALNSSLEGERKLLLLLLLPMLTLLLLLMTTGARR